MPPAVGRVQPHVSLVAGVGGVHPADGARLHIPAAGLRRVDVRAPGGNEESRGDIRLHRMHEAVAAGRTQIPVAGLVPHARRGIARAAAHRTEERLGVLGAIGVDRPGDVEPRVARRQPLGGELPDVLVAAHGQRLAQVLLGGGAQLLVVLARRAVRGIGHHVVVLQTDVGQRVGIRRNTAGDVRERHFPDAERHPQVVAERPPVPRHEFRTARRHVLRLDAGRYGTPQPQCVPDIVRVERGAGVRPMHVPLVAPGRVPGVGLLVDFGVRLADEGVARTAYAALFRRQDDGVEVLLALDRLGQLGLDLLRAGDDVRNGEGLFRCSGFVHGYSGR